MATVTQKKVNKRYDAAAAKITPDKQYSFEEAVALLKSMPATKFDQSVDLSFRLGNAVGKPGETVRVPFIVRGSEAVMAVAFSIDFDETVLECTGIDWTFERAPHQCERERHDRQVRDRVRQLRLDARVAGYRRPVQRSGRFGQPGGGVGRCAGAAAS